MSPKIWTEKVIQSYVNASKQIPAYLWLERSPIRKIRPKKALAKTIMNSENGTSYDAFERDIAMVNFYFENPLIFQFGKQERMTFFNFLAQLGGTFGLFMGISFISIIELVYWLIYAFFKSL